MSSSHSVVQRARNHQQDGELGRIWRYVEDLIELEEKDLGFSTFFKEIINKPLPKNFKMSIIPYYGVHTDPKDHFDAFKDYIDLAQVYNLARCHCFIVILTKSAMK